MMNDVDDDGLRAGDIHRLRQRDVGEGGKGLLRGKALFNSGCHADDDDVDDNGLADDVHRLRQRDVGEGGKGLLRGKALFNSGCHADDDDVDDNGLADDVHRLRQRDVGEGRQEVLRGRGLFKGGRLAEDDDDDVPAGTIRRSTATWCRCRRTAAFQGGGLCSTADVSPKMMMTTAPAGDVRGLRQRDVGEGRQEVLRAGGLFKGGRLAKDDDCCSLAGVRARDACSRQWAAARAQLQRLVCERTLRAHVVARDYDEITVELYDDMGKSIAEQLAAGKLVELTDYIIEDDSNVKQKLVAA
ncbi:unnamed protein product, partial [Iphiclides podalirius]